MVPLIANIVFACPNGTWIEAERRWEGAPRDLTLFYARLLGMSIVREDWLKIGWDGDRRSHLAFGDGPTENYRPSRWGDPDSPAQVLLEIPVADLAPADDFVCGLGVAVLDVQTDNRTYADPIGHPFRL